MARKGQKSETRGKEDVPKSTRLSRAKSERMYFMGRAAEAEGAAAAFIVSGQTGKIWTVTVPENKSRPRATANRNSKFRCNCPDNLIRKGTCKHMIFVCLRILKIPEKQLQCVEHGGDLDVSLLHEVLDNAPAQVDNRYTAPAALKARLKAIAGDFESGGEIAKVEPRLPDKEESCPICYEDLLDGTSLVYCGYGCGKPVHTECFSRYSDAQKDLSNNKLKCVTCRTDWVMPGTNVIGKRGMLIGRRAINLAEEMPDQFVVPRSRSRAGSNSKASKSKNRTSKSKTAGPSSRRSKSASKTEGGVRQGRVTRKRTKAESTDRLTRSGSKARRSKRLAEVAAAETESTKSSPSSRKTLKVSKGKSTKKAEPNTQVATRRTRRSPRTAQV